jgi:hypothetical protein|tara:strand:- start:1658 stop:1876 length:219 start_codon:yes stop_codon:yes gene_type:complete
MNSKEFSLIIENVVKEKRSITYIEAIVWYCDENNIEVETTARLISKSLKEKIQLEAQEKNLLKIKKAGALPV